MAKTSDVSLLPLPSTPPATGLFAKSTAAASDTSFRQTLESARQQESSRKPEDADSEDPKKATDSATKKTSKSTKPKRANTKDAKKGEPTDDATDEGKAEATAASDATAPAAATDDATEEDATADEHAAAKDETAKVVGAAPDPTATAAAQVVTPQAEKSAAPVKAKGEESKAAPTKRGAIVVDAKKATQPAEDSADDQTAGASADAGAATATDTAATATAQAVQTAPVKGAGLGTGKVESHGLMDSGNNPAATDATAAAASAAAAASTPSTPAAVDSDIDSALSTIEDALASGDDGDRPAKGVSSPDSSPVAGTFEQQLQRASTPVKADAPAPATSPEVQFAEANHPKIVTGVQSQLLPNGGTMQIRLDPPELGALQVTVHMRDGVMTAAFETSNDDATRMLSHSLNQLKTVLESAGVSVEKLHVQQAPKQESQGGQDQSGGGSREQQQEARQEQQRREMLQRMWRKLAGAGDPIDFVA